MAAAAVVTAQEIWVEGRVAEAVMDMAGVVATVLELAETVVELLEESMAAVAQAVRMAKGSEVDWEVDAEGEAEETSARSTEEATAMGAHVAV